MVYKTFRKQQNESNETTWLNVGGASFSGTQRNSTKAHVIGRKERDIHPETKISLL